MPSPQTNKIAREFPNLLTTSEVASRVGRSKKIVVRWRDLGYVLPSRFTMNGATKVWLYTEDDLRTAYNYINRTTSKRKASESSGG